MKPEVKTIYHNNGQLYFEYPTVNGKLHGTAKDWYEHGQLRCETPYLNGERNGLLRFWGKDGQLKSETSFIKDQIYGMVVVYENGKLQSQRYYERGMFVTHVPEGTFYPIEEEPVLTEIERGYHDNGQLRYEVTQVNGLANGLARGWSENGRLRYKINYVNGRANGIVRWWNANGQLETETYQSNGKRNGIERFWEEDGQLCSQRFFVNGHCITNIPEGTLYPIEEEPV